jgi:uncharacterized small protein (DUF1192 family)
MNPEKTYSDSNRYVPPSRAECEQRIASLEAEIRSRTSALRESIAYWQERKREATE